MKILITIALSLLAFGAFAKDVLVKNFPHPSGTPQAELVLTNESGNWCPPHPPKGVPSTFHWKRAYFNIGGKPSDSHMCWIMINANTVDVFRIEDMKSVNLDIDDFKVASSPVSPHKTKPKAPPKIDRSAYCQEFVDVLIISSGGRRANYSPQQMLTMINQGAYPHLTEKDKKQAINGGYFGLDGYEVPITDAQFRAETVALCINNWKPLRDYQPLK